ncbi:hypothetical protein [Streptomyces sp. NBC_00582]|uniref:hypothetical protein n=1 Tax=Streptomyces sp. NBC_00582 TaxID=2975783 RepID=UPI002E807F3C|nr:hypothetical protein [Streptomyces sp. NBC_00582]WUB59927.1 hypothetical protein OG852_05745 [Streptomyces sp. NBC_00582]
MTRAVAERDGADGSSWRSLWSRNSALSIGSVDSFLSIGSVGSSLSVASVGGFLSVGSVGSAASFASVGSWLSAGSVLSAQSTGAVLAWCSRAGGGRAIGAAAATLAGVAVLHAWRASRPTT